MKIFDLHCDTITGLSRMNAGLRENDMHIDLQKLRKADQLAQCFAVFVRFSKDTPRNISGMDTFSRAFMEGIRL